jgi:hypothetical protein
MEWSKSKLKFLQAIFARLFRQIFRLYEMLNAVLKQAKPCSMGLIGRTSVTPVPMTITNGGSALSINLAIGRSSGGKGLLSMGLQKLRVLRAKCRP